MDESVASQHPRAFHLVFCTADKRRGTGGEQIVFDRAVLLKARLKTEGKDKTENKSKKSSFHKEGISRKNTIISFKFKR